MSLRTRAMPATFLALPHCGQSYARRVELPEELLLASGQALPTCALASQRSGLSQLSSETAPTPPALPGSTRMVGCKQADPQGCGLGLGVRRLSCVRLVVNLSDSPRTRREVRVKIRMDGDGKWDTSSTSRPAHGLGRSANTSNLLLCMNPRDLSTRVAISPANKRLAA